jgi:hypothetical protein
VTVSASDLNRGHADSFEIEEFGGETYPSLEAAQQAALLRLAPLLARIISERLDSGEYVVANGVVTRSTQVCDE